MVERVTILSINEPKENVNKILKDILNKNSENKNIEDLKKTFSAPLKEARENFETEYLKAQLKNITEIFPKLQTT